MFAYIICLHKIFVFSLQALLPLRRCPFYMSDFFGSHAPLVFPSSLSLPSEGRDGGGRSRDALVLLPEGFPLLPLDLVQREGWRSLWSRVRCMRAHFCLLGSFVDWGSRSCSLAVDSCYLFSVPVGSPSSSLHARRGVGEGDSSGAFLCSRLPLPPHLCTLGEVVGQVSLPSAAPVRVLPGLPIFGLGSREGTMSPLLVEWLSCAVLLLTLSLRLPCSVQRSGRCGRGSSRFLFSLVRSLPVCEPLAVS